VPPMRIKRLGVRDQFGQSGTIEELLTHYGIDSTAVIAAVREVTS
jgi:transketolase